MNALITFIFSFTSFLFSVALLLEPGGAAADEDGVYIVYMGAPASTKGSLRDDHAQLLDSLLKRKKDALVHNYKHGFSGFAALLSTEEAHSIAESPGVVSVFPDPVLQLHTTRSWDFLKYETSVTIESNPSSDSNPTYHDSESEAIIGIIDTGRDSNTFNCNKKIIGARSYGEGWPRDMIGHGTHVASTAAGAEVHGVSYYGLAPGTAKGGSPGSRLAIYQVFSSQNRGRGSTVLAAFDDAIADGGEGISFANNSASPVYPIIYAKSAKKSGVHENATRNCRPDSMEQELIKGKIVVCDNEDSLFPQIKKQNEVKKLGGIGVILIDDELRGVGFNFGVFPMSVISSKDGANVLSYINSIKNPVATILPSSTNAKTAPTIPYFSSRGPSTIPRNILKAKPLLFCFIELSFFQG
ncbi:hypothetical protein V6N12_071058 [Hibiscus sabdariffa]|uniref:Uncharacterized protein n=1 Tax=Hibiscus sabdariffa TaxID=183260 RepID=A0ABR2FJ78_9ROSI